MVLKITQSRKQKEAYYSTLNELPLSECTNFSIKKNDLNIYICV